MKREDKQRNKNQEWDEDDEGDEDDEDDEDKDKDENQCDKNDNNDKDDGSNRDSDNSSDNENNGDDNGGSDSDEEYERGDGSEDKEEAVAAREWGTCQVCNEIGPTGTVCDECSGVNMSVFLTYAGRVICPGDNDEEEEMLDLIHGGINSD